MVFNCYLLNKNRTFSKQVLAVKEISVINKVVKTMYGFLFMGACVDL